MPDTRKAAHGNTGFSALELLRTPMPPALSRLAACAGMDTAMFFTPERKDEALKVCGTCPVARECRDFAVANAISCGVWGSTQAERARLRAPKPKPGKGSAHHDAKLTEATVIEARQRHQDGDSLDAIAADLGVARTVLGSAVRGATWGHVRFGLKAGKHKPPGLPKGEAHYQAKLTAAIVRAARREHKAGRASISQLARRYGVTETVMRKAVRRQTWKDVQ